MTDQLNFGNLDMELSIVKSEIEVLKNKGTKTSAVRARAHLINIKKVCDVLRKEVLAYSKQQHAKPVPVEVEEVVEPVEIEEVVEPMQVLAEVEPVAEDVPIKIKRKRRVPTGRKKR